MIALETGLGLVSVRQILVFRKKFTTKVFKTGCLKQNSPQNEPNVGI